MPWMIAVIDIEINVSMAFFVYSLLSFSFLLPISLSFPYRVNHVFEARFIYSSHSAGKMVRNKPFSVDLEPR